MNAHEQAVITALLEGNQQHLIPTLPVAYFPSEQAQNIFRVMKELYAAMKPVDAYSVAQDKRSGEGSVIFGMMHDSFSVLTIDKHVTELRKEYLRRMLKIKIVAANKMIDSGEELMTIMQSLKLDEADAIEKSAKIYNPYEQTESYVDHVSAVSENTLQTGIKKIDEIMHGVAPGQVLTFLGRAGCFKTSFLQYCLHNYSIKSGKVAAMFSLEMPVACLVERNLQAMKGWTCCGVENHFKISQHVPETMTQYAEAYKNFAIVDGRVSLDEIPDYIRLINKKWHGSQVGAIGIDYMGLIETQGDQKEYEKISNLARQLKTLAKDIHMPVICLAQTNRTAADGVQEIFMHQGRGSGAIEEAADFILGAFKSDDSEGAGVVFKVLKNRRGPTGAMFTVDVDKKTFAYTGDAWEYEPPKRKRNADTFDA